MASSARNLYHRYLSVITAWPVESSKVGRDLGVRIRSRVGVIFPKGEFTQADDQLPSLTAEIEALERITSNANQKRFSNASDGYTAASGLTVEHLHRATSTEFIEGLKWANGNVQLFIFENNH